MSTLAFIGGRAVQALVNRLRFPHVFFLLLATFVINLLVPDFIPFVDEIILGLLTTLVGLMRAPREVAPAAGTPMDAAKTSK